MSLMAGEHACRMSIQQIPFGHDDFDSRHCQVFGALAFSENVGRIERCQDPAQDLLVTWLSKATSFSRIIAAFTHTGVGAAENEDGVWFIVQVFATFKTVMHRKDQMIAVSRLVNAIRTAAGGTPLALSIIGCSRLKLFCERSRVDDPLSKVNDQNAKLFFEPCSSAKAIIENLPASAGAFNRFLEILAKGEPYLSTLQTAGFIEVAFTRRDPKKQQTNVTFCVLLATAEDVYYPLSEFHHINFPHALRCINLVNDYRMAHGKKVLDLSRSWSKAADQQCQKMANRQIEIEGRSLIRAIKWKDPDSEVSFRVDVIAMTHDPLPELLLYWIADRKGKAKVLGDFRHFAFGMAVADDKVCYAIRLLGTIPMKRPSTEHPLFSDHPPLLYLPLSSDSEDGDGPKSD
jgi:uncharacterized protein YkwD